MKEMKFDRYYEKDMMYLVDLNEFKKHGYHSNELILALFRNYREKVTMFGCRHKITETEEFKIKFVDVPTHHNPVLLENEKGFYDSIHNGWYKDYKIVMKSQITEFEVSYYVSDLLSSISNGSIDLYINGEKIKLKK